MEKMKFFKPTTEFKEMILLQEIENNHTITQKQLAEAIGAAPSMVNVYISELEEKNYLNREYISSKIVNYKITPQGLKRKNYLLICYMRELLALYKLAKSNVEKFLQSIENKGYKNILLYGAGEVAETIIGVIRDREIYSLNVLAIIDDDLQKQGTEILGYRIIDRSEIEKYNPDAVVITSYTFEEDIMEKLNEVGYEIGKVVRFFGK
ncbi:winged helix-turn-helix domain-containing protein [Anaerosalibacter sp. Marseille-P3206]|uniref:winged helix-turn-helix domain-containing protein n=1 Tax=Anaerosalibacter sp. Marseille-P3206 TaxID=1871005 RepID=UPI0009873434|nr:winged helix-turn-helix domain-containing protein [Anaerosalibacter sp. Marseille-P3206]